MVVPCYKKLFFFPGVEDIRCKLEDLNYLNQSCCLVTGHAINYLAYLSDAKQAFQQTRKQPKTVVNTFFLRRAIWPENAILIQILELYTSQKCPLSSSMLGS